MTAESGRSDQGELLPDSVLVFGAGGHARAIADVLARQGVAVSCTVDPAALPWRGVLMCREDERGVQLARQHSLRVVLGFGGTIARLGLARRLIAEGLQLAPVLAATATVSRRAAVAEGAAVFEQAHLGPDVVIGVAAVVNTHAVVEHDCRVGDGAFISPGAVLSGGSSVGETTMVGAGAVLLPGIAIGAGAVVAAGAVVTRDVEDGATVIGMPATPR